MLTEEEIEILEAAIQKIKDRIILRTEDGSLERDDAMYALQDACEDLGEFDE